MKLKTDLKMMNRKLWSKVGHGKLWSAVGLSIIVPGIIFNWSPAASSASTLFIICFHSSRERNGFCEFQELISLGPQTRNSTDFLQPAWIQKGTVYLRDTTAVLTIVHFQEAAHRTLTFYHSRFVFQIPAFLFGQSHQNFYLFHHLFLYLAFHLFLHHDLLLAFHGLIFQAVWKEDL